MDKGMTGIPALFLGSFLLVFGFAVRGLSSSSDQPSMQNSRMEQAPRPVARLLKKGMTQKQFEQTIHPTRFLLRSFKPFTLFVEYETNLFPGQRVEASYRSDGKEYRVTEWFVRPRQPDEHGLKPFISP